MATAGIGILQARGAQSPAPSRYKPVWTDRFFQGYYTNRNPFRSPLSAFYAEGWGLGKTDALIDGLNTELSLRLTLCRRPGWIALPQTSSSLGGGAFPSPITNIYSYRQYSAQANQWSVVIDTTGTVYYLTPTGWEQLTTKSNGAGVTRFLGVGNVLYLTDSVDFLAWQPGAPSPNPRNWGIAIGPFSGLSGPNSPGAGTDVSVTNGAAWANPANVTVADATYATVTLGPIGTGNTGAVSAATLGGWGNSALPASIILTPGATSTPLVAQNFGFSVPLNATITGVQLSTTRQQTGGTSGMYSTNIVLYGINCTAKNDTYGVSPWTGSPTPVTYGGAGDVWGAALTPAIVNSSSFGIVLQALCTGAPGSGAIGSITALTMTVYYTTPSTNVSDLLEATTYGFSPAQPTTIGGITVTVTGYQSAGNPGALSVQLLAGGSPVGTPKTGIQLGTTNGAITLGGINDSWGANLQAGDIGQTGFGVAIQALNSAGSNGTWSIDCVQISLYATGGPPVTEYGSGSCSATSGYQYVCGYWNANSGHCSTCTPASLGTGIYSGIQGLQIGLTASTDPQVTGIKIFRTADGGSSLYEISGSPVPNVTGNYLDTTASSNQDYTLNILSPAPIDHANDPPPTGATIPVYSMGRVWVAVGNILYASGGPDTLVGNGAEAFPPLNYWTLPSPITRMVPTAAGLVLFLTDRVQMMAGGPSIAQFYIQPLVDGIGLLSYDALDVYGSQAFLFTADQQFISFDMSSGLTELGFPIEDQLRLLSPTAASVAYHTSGLDRGVFVCDGISKTFRCVPQQPPDFSITGPVWSPPGVIASGSLNLLKSIQTSDGVRQLFGAAGNSIVYRDSSFSTFTDVGTSYDASFTVGSIVLANPGQLAELGFITSDFVRVGTSPLVSVLLDETSGTFSGLPLVVSDPPRLYGISGAPASLYSNRYYFRQSTAGGGTPGPVWCRHMQVKIDFGTDIVQNEILSNTVWGSILEEGAA